MKYDIDNTDFNHIQYTLKIKNFMIKFYLNGFIYI